MGAELFHADRQTDGWTEDMKLIVAFRNIANVAKNAVRLESQTQTLSGALVSI
jgi:hypothetical protein